MYMRSFHDARCGGVIAEIEFSINEKKKKVTMLEQQAYQDVKQF